MHFFMRLSIAAMLLPLLMSAAATAGTDGDNAERLFTYSWPFTDDDAMRPRGGTTRGPSVSLAPGPTDDWERLREPGLTGLEQDRRAILAMAGPYRTTFDFIEIAGFVPDYEPPAPYQSWGTEYVYVVADEPDFISLQHIIVMFFEDDDGAVQGPAVVKHWRQDWTYEDTRIHEYVGENTWVERELSAEEVEGTWSQAVYQVDDSPRYESVGRWRHAGNYSTWLSGETWRPLPRREFSVRDDYDVLIGTNRHTITPTGWVHEEHNRKVVLTGAGKLRDDLPILARETGLNRYERIVDHDFSAGDEYWSRTAPFWADVRAAWEDVKSGKPRFTLATEVDGERLFERMFEYAGSIESADDYRPDEGRAYVDEVLSRWISSGEAPR